MKSTQFPKLLVLLMALSCLVAGCRKSPTPLTRLPGARVGDPSDPGLSGMIPAGPEFGETASGIPLGEAGSHLGWPENPDIFRSETVYFDFDSSAVKSSEQSKVQTVAAYLAENSATAVRVEGHCDERGTEEYNRALGERRALALRESLITSGIAPSRVETLSYGEDRPANPGHDQEAWRMNRRGEFILLTPP